MTERGSWPLAAALLWGAACGPTAVEERSARDERKTLETFRPPFKAVNLHEKDVAVETAAREFLRQSGMKAELVVPPGLPRVRLELRDAPPLKALDALGARWVVEAAVPPGFDRLRFEPGAPPEGPVVYVKHARIRAEAAPGRLKLRLSRAPGVRPIASHHLEILEFSGVDGATLLPEDFALKHATLRHHGFTRPDLEETIVHPGSAAGGIARLRGYFLLLFPQETGRPVLSARGVGPTEVEYRGYRIRLESFESKDGTHRVTLSARGRVRPKPEPLEGDDPPSAYAGPGVFGTGDVELLAADASPIQASLTEQVLEGDAEDLVMKLAFTTAPKVDVAAVRVACVYSHFHDRLDFEFRDLPLR